MYRFFIHLVDDTEIEWTGLTKAAAERMYRTTHFNTPRNVVSYGWEEET